MKFSLIPSQFPDLAQIFEKEQQNIIKMLSAEMFVVRDEILTKNQAGQKANGGSIKSYSSSYVKAINSGYVAGKAPGSLTPNLTATGVLNRAMRIEPGDTPGTVLMFFDGTHPKAKRVSKRSAKSKVNKAKKSGADLATRSVKSKGLTNAQVFKISGIDRSNPRVQGKGGGGDVQNAVIAQAQYDMGRDGWFQFSTKRIEIIQKKLSDYVLKILSGK